MASTLPMTVTGNYDGPYSTFAVQLTLKLKERTSTGYVLSLGHNVAIRAGVDGFQGTTLHTSWGEDIRMYKSDITSTVSEVTVNFGSSYSATASGHYTSNSGNYYESTVTLKYDAPVAYTVSYSANGGSGAPSSQTKLTGESVTISSQTPTRTNYSFVAWNTRSDGSGTRYNPGTTYSADADLSLYAIWESSNVVTVSYDANGGSPNPTSQTTTPGGSVTLSSGPTSPKTCKISFDVSSWSSSSPSPIYRIQPFYGWATTKAKADSGQRDYTGGQSISVNSNMHLYAAWSSTTYGKLPSVSISGARFFGWCLDDGSVPEANDTLSSNVTLYGMFEGNSAVVNWTDGYSGVIIKREIVEIGSAATPPNMSSYPPPRPGATFIGWSNDYTYITRDITINALWNTNMSPIWIYLGGRWVNYEPEEPAE